MISHTAEYALRAMVFLAGSPARPRTTQEISESTGVPATYLSKVLRSMGRAGLVSSQRGPSGGFLLAMDPSAIAIFDVVDAVDPWRRIDRCPVGNPTHDVNLCPLHRRLANAQDLIEVTFRESSLKDLLSDPPSGDASCEFPRRSG